VFLDWLYPTYFPVVFKAAELYNEDVTPHLLSFIRELVHSRNGRIRFPDSSANGIILFKEVSKIITTYSEYVKSQTGDKRYRNIKLLLQIMIYMLGGNYIVFGVFQVYQDTCFIQALESMFSILDSE
jgi:exportin-7